MSSIRKYGFKKSVPDVNDRKYSEHKKFSIGAPLPTSFDLRSNMPPVYDQGDLGSCTANATCAAVEYDMKVQNEVVALLSRLFLYFVERKIDGDISQDGGSTLRTAITAVNQYGICNDNLWTYDPSKFALEPPVSAYNEAKLHKGVKSFSLAQNLYELQHCLAVFQRPFVFGFQVYQAFESQEVADNGIMPMPHPRESNLGGHAVCAVKYEPGYFIIRNSWGENWGLPGGGLNAGHFKMPEAFILNPEYCSDFWCVQQIE